MVHLLNEKKKSIVDFSFSRHVLLFIAVSLWTTADDILFPHYFFLQYRKWRTELPCEVAYLSKIAFRTLNTYVLIAIKNEPQGEQCRPEPVKREGPDP